MATLLCPKCGSSEVVPIVYGTPTYDLADLVPAGDVHIADRALGDGEPTEHCSRCGHQWSTPALQNDAVEVNMADLPGWVAGRTGVDLETVRAVLDLEEEFQTAIGIIDRSADTVFRFYDPSDWTNHPAVINPAALATDAERFLGVPRTVAMAVFDAELDYFEMVGLVDPD